MKLKKKLHFENIFCIELRGLSGGLCLFWNNIYNVDVYFWCDSYIKVHIVDRKGNAWVCNFIYGNPNFGRRREQWKEITATNYNKVEPQLFIGDFNDVLSQEEKIGLHPKPHSQVTMPAISSDHSPLILNLKTVFRIRKSFKFEAFWADKEECEKVVKKGWGKEVSQSCEWTRITRRMNNCKEELKKWSKSTFKRADKEINRLKEEMKKLQDSNFTEEKQNQVHVLKEKITALWKQEEKFWGQRSRLKWLKWGDKNTSFFHATTIQRRERNRIERLKNEAGYWLEEREEIMRHIEEHFEALFTSTTRQRYDNTLSKIPVRVTEEMNRDLISEVSDDEIRNAVFSMGSLKAPGSDGLNGLFYQKYWEVIKKEVCEVVK
ncbi:hypothetical protein Ahy_A03g011263 [Arachis hypogaea]|uniref:Endonuclease/exonuclease/phosphatase domain-containing protein n=1 Tax=Arachis hypogaea TaxID=3818 RepID=A0A445DQ83_ARAHY|nr:hypothetical protein Ahy_A03g011263 [Arachis hypogaea]